MERISVERVMSLVTKEASIVGEDSSLVEIAEKILEDPKTRTVYVVNSKGKLVGIIPVMELIQYLYAKYIPEEYKLYRIPMRVSVGSVAKDIMLPPVWVKKEESITSALRKMFKHGVQELPVVNEEMEIIGDLNILELINAWVERQRK